MQEVKINPSLTTLIEIVSDVMGVEKKEVVNVFNVLFNVIEPELNTKFRITDSKIKSKKSTISMEFMRDVSLQEGYSHTVTIYMVKENYVTFTNINGSKVANPGNTKLSFNILYESNKFKSLFDPSILSNNPSNKGFNDEDEEIELSDREIE